MSTIRGCHTGTRMWGVAVIAVLASLFQFGCAAHQVRPLSPQALSDRVVTAARESGLELDKVAGWRQQEPQEVEVPLPWLKKLPALSKAGNLSKPTNPLIPFESNDEIRAFAVRNARGSTVIQQVTGLVEGIYAIGSIEKLYDASRTRTAAETLHTRRGNCFAFTNLFVAAARSIGLQAGYMDASIGNSDVHEENGLVVHSRHIVAEVMTNVGPIVVDFYEVTMLHRRHWYQPLTDPEVVALFLNNLGYEAMQHDVDPEPYFRTAVLVAPEVPSPWNNLAVYLKTHGRTPEAKDILLAATSTRVNSFAPYFNLGLIYLQEGAYQKAEDFFKKAMWRRHDNPFVFYSLGVSYLRQGNNRKALFAFKHALRLDATMVAARSKVDRLEHLSVSRR